MSLHKGHKGHKLRKLTQSYGEHFVFQILINNKTMKKIRKLKHFNFVRVPSWVYSYIMIQVFTHHTHLVVDLLVFIKLHQRVTIRLAHYSLSINVVKLFLLDLLQVMQMNGWVNVVSSHTLNKMYDQVHTNFSVTSVWFTLLKIQIFGTHVPLLRAPPKKFVSHRHTFAKNAMQNAFFFGFVFLFLFCFLVFGFRFFKENEKENIERKYAKCRNSF